MSRDGANGGQPLCSSATQPANRCSVLGSEPRKKCRKLSHHAEEASCVQAKLRCSTPPPRIVDRGASPPPLRRAPIRDRAGDVTFSLALDEREAPWKSLDQSWRPSPYHAMCVGHSDFEMSLCFTSDLQWNAPTTPLDLRLPEPTLVSVSDAHSDPFRWFAR
eukprot:TRINITY_DN16014_c0_g3_i1.p1 TRINITY_DN16014_c0_g3~~TRINITY_DN16014_c0_g3_i1.p1  ORF type:complete len:174 (+),score=8.97 TRINITY_DN16014_c0_g3_i1:37-522(+)